MSIWQHLFSFEGRISRRTYWYAVIADIMCTVIFLALWIIPVDTYFMFFMELGVLELYDAVNIFRLLTLLVGLPLSIWAGHTITVKRLHDRNRSGWWTLIGFVPGIGPLWLGIECGFRKGTPGLNRYGEPPIRRSNRIRAIGQNTPSMTAEGR